MHKMYMKRCLIFIGLGLSLIFKVCKIQLSPLKLKICTSFQGNLFANKIEK